MSSNPKLDEALKYFGDIVTLAVATNKTEELNRAVKQLASALSEHWAVEDDEI